MSASECAGDSGSDRTFELAELDDRDRRQYVGKVRLVAGHADVVERPVAAAHQPQLADRAGDVRAVRRDQAALTRGDVLRGIEREARDVRDAADLPAAV